MGRWVDCSGCTRFCCAALPCCAVLCSADLYVAPCCTAQCCAALHCAAVLKSRKAPHQPAGCHPAVSCHPLPLPSHNFSQAAWGLLSLETGSLLIRSYELSVVCFPSLEAACECTTALLFTPACCRHKLHPCCILLVSTWQMNLSACHPCSWQGAAASSSRLAARRCAAAGRRRSARTQVRLAAACSRLQPLVAAALQQSM